MQYISANKFICYLLTCLVTSALTCKHDMDGDTDTNTVTARNRHGHSHSSRRIRSCTRLVIDADYYSLAYLLTY